MLTSVLIRTIILAKSSRFLIRAIERSTRNKDLLTLLVAGGGFHPPSGFSRISQKIQQLETSNFLTLLKTDFGRYLP